MNVLSLFDGMSCGRIALGRAGIPVTNYYASEVDKYAIKVSQANYPDIQRLGCVTDWHNWDLPSIDLLIGGSPCQGFSFAGKQLNFDDPRSKLFFEFVEILNFYNPKYFLLENVKMKKEYQDIISKLLGVKPIEINSSLVSAQNRKRLYWTNIPGIEQPEDKGILLKDIIEDGESGHKYNRNDGLTTEMDKSYCLNASDWRGLNRNQNQTAIAIIKNRGELQERNEKSMCIDANYHKGADNHGQRTQIVCGASMVGRKINNGKRDDYNKEIKTKQYIEINENPNKSRYLSTVQKDTLLADKKEGRHIPEDLKYRKLTPLECERLQTIPDNYTNHVSNTQRYKMIGNGWTVDVIAHIFKGMKIPVTFL